MKYEIDDESWNRNLYMIKSSEVERQLDEQWNNGKSYLKVVVNDSSLIIPELSGIIESLSIKIPREAIRLNKREQ